MYNAFRRDGYPGINGIADAGDFWIFNPASETKEETDYGKHPFIVDKKTVSVRCFDYLDEDDWKLLEASTQIDVPVEYRPVYFDEGEELVLCKTKRGDYHDR